MSAAPFMPFYVADYLGDTQHLTAEEHGAYLLLLMTMWRAGKLPNDPVVLTRIARVHPPHWKRVAKTIMPFFEVTDDGFLVQKRLLLERENATQDRQSRGTKSRPKSDVKPLETNDAASRHARAGFQTSEPEGRAEALPIEKANAFSLSDEKSKPNAFERFWSLYPQRKGANPRKPAKARFESHLAAGVDPEEMIAGARAYAAEMAADGQLGTPYVAQTVTWLNQERWRDKTSPPPSALAPDDPNRNRPPGAPSHEELLAKYALHRQAPEPETGLEDREPDDGEVLRGRDGSHREGEGNNGHRSVLGHQAGNGGMVIMETLHPQAVRGPPGGDEDGFGWSRH